MSSVTRSANFAALSVAGQHRCGCARRRRRRPWRRRASRSAPSACGRYSRVVEVERPGSRSRRPRPSPSCRSRRPVLSPSIFCCDHLLDERGRPGTSRAPRRWAACRSSSARRGAKVSRPTMSAVRNTALFGRPIAGPKILSTSSTVSSAFCIVADARAASRRCRCGWRRSWSCPCRRRCPCRASPRRSGPCGASTPGSVSGAGHQLEQLHVADRVEEVRDQEAASGRPAPRPSSIPVTERPEVLELTIAPGLRCGSTFANSACLTAEVLLHHLDDPVALARCAAGRPRSCRPRSARAPPG